MNDIKVNSAENTLPVLETKGLNLHFSTRRGVIKAVEDFDIELRKNRTLVILGESGCGKSSLARAVLRLLPNNVARYDGEVRLDGECVTDLTDEQFRKQVRWTKMSLVPQAAMNSFNPVLKIADQIVEPLYVHNKVQSRKEAVERVLEVFNIVGIPKGFLARYPFEFSGGMKQRAAIAMALVAKPELILMDEPTSALDLITQANIMNALKKIKWELGITYILITHDISTSSELADDIGVMYAARLVETAAADVFFDKPLHPYSEMLMNSVPRLHEEKQPMSIPGTPPDLLDLPTGCRYAPRCPAKHAQCDEEPPTFEPEKGRCVKCWLYKD